MAVTTVGSNKQSTESELKWVTIPQLPEMEFEEKATSKFLQNPLVPIGCLCTAGILVAGLRSFIQKDGRKQQKMMRLRVLSQGLTFVALGLGMFIATFKSK